MFNKRSGFTLLELMITTSIILILTVGAIISFSSAAAKSRDSKRKTDLERIRTALEIYRQENNCYPTNLSIGFTAGGGGSECTNSGLIGRYMDSVPVDPKVVTQNYGYQRGGTTRTYILVGCLEVELAIGTPSGAFSINCDASITTDNTKRIYLYNP